MKNCPYCSKPVENKKRRYCSRACYRLDFVRIYKPHNKVYELAKAKTDRIRKRILIESRGHKCEGCLNSIWRDLPIVLELEHKDGNADNNLESNLSLLCPNCHSQTSTYKSRNRQIDHSRKRLRRGRYLKRYKLP